MGIATITFPEPTTVPYVVERTHYTLPTQRVIIIY